MIPVTVARNAMATRFEIVALGEDPVALRAAAEEALAEVERLESRLSLYRPASVISQLNANAAKRPVRVDPELFEFLQEAARLSELTAGAFDVTVAPLVRCWGFMGGSGTFPPTEAVAAARECVGMPLVQFDSENSTISFAREGVMLDLGAIGKGYALDRMLEVLVEAGVTSALLHGGTSTVYGLGLGPEDKPWKVAVPKPAANDMPSSATAAPDELGGDVLAIVELRDEALSISADWGKFFVHKGKRYGHVIDPRSGYPVDQSLLAAVVLPSAMETDALSTALLTLGGEGLAKLAAIRPGIKALVALRETEGFSVRTHGLKLR